MLQSSAVQEKSAQHPASGRKRGHGPCEGGKTSYDLVTDFAKKKAQNLRPILTKHNASLSSMKNRMTDNAALCFISPPRFTLRLPTPLRFNPLSARHPFRQGRTPRFL